MALRAPEDAWPTCAMGLLVLVILFVFLILVFVAILVKILVVFLLYLHILVVFFLKFVGDRVQSHRMRLRHFQLGFALGAAQDLSLFHLVFVHIYFRGTLWTAQHSPSSVFCFWLVHPQSPRTYHPAYYIPGEESQPQPFPPLDSVTQQLG